MRPDAPGGFGGINPGQDPTAPGRCKKYQVTFVSIDVSKASDGFLDHSLEAEFNFSVNHEAKKWKKDFGKGLTNIGVSIIADVPSEQSQLLIQVSGKEKDLIKDDNLAGFSRSHGQAENWGMGAQSASASNGSISYTMNYKIECAPETAASVPREAMIDMIRKQQAQREEAEARRNKEVLLQQAAMLHSHGVSTNTSSRSMRSSGSPKSSNAKLSDAQLMARALDRFSREGWECVHISEKEVLFKGYGDFPDLVNNWYEEEQNKKKSKKKK